MTTREFSANVPGLGEIRVVGLTMRDYETAAEQAEGADVSERASTFADLVFQSLLLDASLKERVPSMKAATVEALELLAADQLGLQFTLGRPYEEFVAAQKDLPPCQRLYKAHLEGQARSRAQWEQMVRRMEEFEAAAPAIRDALKQAGFWVPLSAPLRLSVGLEALVYSGEATPEKVTALILERFRRDEYKALKAMVREWYSFDYFALRRKVIRDCVEAHTKSLFTLSIPTLLPLAEGFLRSQLGVPRYADIGNWMAREMERARNGSESLYQLDIGALVPYVKNGVYLHIPSPSRTPEKYNEWVEQNGLVMKNLLHRHAILHGLQADYASEENSLRAFFLLDSLAHLYSD